MKINHNSLASRLLKDQRGQVIVVMAVLIAAFMGIAALTLGAGSSYVTQRQLQASANAAALAGAQALPNANAATVASTYDMTSDGLNSNPHLAGVTMSSGYPKLECLTSLTSQGLACIAPANANAMQVKQQIAVPLLFGGLFGHPTITLSATATASMRGASSGAYNVAIIVDATASMSDTDSDSQCSGSRMSCALAGVRILIQDLSPCSPNSATCGTVTAGTNGSGNVVNSVDRVALFGFPNVSTSTYQYDYDCSSSNPTSMVYTFPTAGAPSYTTINSSTYEIVGYSSDYKTYDAATTLNTASTNNNYVKAVGGKSGCTPMNNPGGEGTYYAGVIYAAQSSLIAEQAAFPGSQNVIIIISDGDSTITAGTKDSHSNLEMGAATTQTTYPGTKQECAQAVTAAKSAATAGTQIFSVAYGAKSSGCGTDTSPAITPCSTMQHIASIPSNFYSDYTASTGDGSCISASQPTTNLNQIFTDIAGSLTIARLIPNATT